MTARERFTNNQIILLRSLIQRGAAYRAVAIRSWQRITALPLWRRGLVEVWYRQGSNDSLQGPFYALTIVGAQIAMAFVHPAPRGPSGAEQ